jgi:hypothetical protein
MSIFGAPPAIIECQVDRLVGGVEKGGGPDGMTEHVLGVAQIRGAEEKK